ncbi:DUF1796 family putative cysteine peptidase [Methylocella sp.]|uniref:DUF1796 family putative cysteine peptidase n=1 Tax=Methylocella sp. TaxID=1978226 RepID=UPI0037852AB7
MNRAAAMRITERFASRRLSLRPPFLSPAPTLVFDRLISLGGACETAFQARRLARSGRAYPFDWWIAPLDSVAIALDHGPAACFAPEHLLAVADYGGAPALYSRLSQTVHLHEFAKGEDVLALAPDAIAAKLQPKYEALGARLRDDCAQGATLFLRQRLGDRDPSGAALEAALDALMERLGRLSNDWRLLLLDYEPAAARPNLLQGQAERLRDANDLGSRKGWTALFRRLGIACRRAERRFSIEDLRASFSPRR